VGIQLGHVVTRSAERFGVEELERLAVVDVHLLAIPI
jgi:hypothetical protein